MVVAVGEGLVGPSGLVFDAVVVAAEGCEVVDAGFSAVYPSGPVVEVTVDGWHAASGEDAGLVAGLDVATLSESPWV